MAGWRAPEGSPLRLARFPRPAVTRRGDFPCSGVPGLGPQRREGYLVPVPVTGPTPDGAELLGPGTGIPARPLPRALPPTPDGATRGGADRDHGHSMR